MRRTGLLFFVLAACSDDSTPATATPADAATDAPLTTDPFCKGRPLLHFCEDFDERAVPGAFAEIGGDATSLRIGNDSTAPSPPNVLTVTSEKGPVFLSTPFAPRSAKANAFFRMRIDKLGADAGVAAFSADSGHRVELALAPDGTVGIRTPDLHTSTVKIEVGTWVSIRWDIRFVDGAARTRLRVGDATAFDAEPVGLTGSDAVERLQIGAAGGNPLTVSFDSVTFEPTVE